MWTEFKAQTSWCLGAIGARQVLVAIAPTVQQFDNVVCHLACEGMNLTLRIILLTARFLEQLHGQRRLLRIRYR